MNCKAQESARKMAAWFESQELPKSCKPCRWLKINDTKLFVANAIATLEIAEPMSVNFIAAYYRLYDLKKYLENVKP